MMRLDRDERERQIDLRAAEIGYMVLSLGVLLAVAVRSYHGDAAFDLLALVLLSRVASQAYVAWRRAYSRRLIECALVAAAIGAVAGALTVLVH